MLFIIYIKNRIITFYEPAQNEYLDYVDINHFIVRKIGLATYDDPFQLQYKMSPSQKSSFDPGLFVAEFAAQWLSGKDNKIKFSQKDIRKIRKKLRDNIQQYAENIQKAYNI